MIFIISMCSCCFCMLLSQIANALSLREMRLPLVNYARSRFCCKRSNSSPIPKRHRHVLWVNIHIRKQYGCWRIVATYAVLLGNRHTCCQLELGRAMLIRDADVSHLRSSHSHTLCVMGILSSYWSSRSNQDSLHTMQSKSRHFFAGFCWRRLPRSHSQNIDFQCVMKGNFSRLTNVTVMILMLKNPYTHVLGSIRANPIVLHCRATYTKAKKGSKSQFCLMADQYPVWAQFSSDPHQTWYTYTSSIHTHVFQIWKRSHLYWPIAMRPNLLHFGCAHSTCYAPRATAKIQSHDLGPNMI